MTFFVKTMRVLLVLTLILALISGIWVEVSARNACAPHEGVVGPSWQRRAAPSLVDSIIPSYQIGERHSIFIRALAKRVLASALTLTAREQPLASIFGLLQRTATPDAQLFESLRKTSSLVLHERDQEVVFATIAERQPLLRLESVQAFRTYRLEPGEAKGAVSIRVEPAPKGAWFSTETRLFYTDLRDCRDFARYWGIIYPGSALTRLDILGAVKRRAEGRHARVALTSALHVSAIAVYARVNHYLFWSPL